MPLLDEMKGTLKADFDVSEMNKLLKTYIDQEIRSEVEIALKRGVENIINSRLEQVQQETASAIDKNMSRHISTFESTYLKGQTYMVNLLKETVGDFKKKTDPLRQEYAILIKELFKVSTKYAFFATLSSDKNNLPNNAVVIFDAVSLNEGHAYDRRTGKFTCPEDGIYHFSWTTVSGAGRDFSSVLVANDKKIAANAVDSDSVSDTMTGTSNVIVRMIKGQKAWIAVQTSEGTHLDVRWNDAPCSMLSGFKL
ncbi:heavy metal-binding protein HIP-like isoform X2 [Mytilus californianus]|uniref:heavy metal-binding protein HIP-like isoform X2 n=1 Tax=Mytilus californianus TaxID=6549 RepID=UPI002246029A|nr:heavy metal-binding protein HIP-like isoform X2 [Mytilus californianus]